MKYHYLLFVCICLASCMNKAPKIPEEHLICKAFPVSNLVITNSSLITCNSKYILIADNKTESVFHLLRRDGSYIGSPA